MTLNHAFIEHNAQLKYQGSPWLVAPWMHRAGSQMSSVGRDSHEQQWGRLATQRSNSIFISGSLSLPKSLTSASEASSCSHEPSGLYFQRLPLVSPARFWSAVIDGNSSLSPSEVSSQRVSLCGSWSHMQWASLLASQPLPGQQATPL